MARLLALTAVLVAASSAVGSTWALAAPAAATPHGTASAHGVGDLDDVARTHPGGGSLLATPPPAVAAPVRPRAGAWRVSAAPAPSSMTGRALPVFALAPKTSPPLPPRLS